MISPPRSVRPRTRFEHADTTHFLHVGLYSTRTTVATKLFLQELQEKHAIDDAECFVDGAPWLHAGLFELGMHFQHETRGDRNPVERAFQEIKRRTDQFYNNFPNANPATVGSWPVYARMGPKSPNLNSAPAGYRSETPDIRRFPSEFDPGSAHPLEGSSRQKDDPVSAAVSNDVIFRRADGLGNPADDRYSAN